MTIQTATPAQTLLALVDDLFFILKIGDTAKRLGLEVHFVSDGPALIARLAHQRPALILLDLTLQSVDFAELLVRLTEVSPHGAIPILGYTTHADWKRTSTLHDKCTKVVTKEALSRSLTELIQAAMPPTEGGR